MDRNDLEVCGKTCCYFWFHSEVKFLTRFDVFLDLVIFAYSNAICNRFLCSKELYLHLFCVISMFLWGRMLIYLNTWRILMNFLCIYLGEGKGGGALMHVYVLEHIFSLYYRTAWLMFTKLGRDEVLMAPHMFKGVLARSARTDPGRGQNMSKGDPFFKKLLQIGRLQRQEACGKKCCYFWLHSKVIFLTRFDVFLDLVILAYFNVISIMQ